MPNNNPLGGAHWSEDHAAELVRLAAGKMSFRAIAAAINAKFGTHYTKSATIGRASRMGLTKASASSAPLTARMAKVQPKKKRIITFGNEKATRVYSSVQREQYKLRCVEIVPRHLSLMDLEAGDCRYPYGDDAVTFCGHPKQEGSSYCSPHAVLCSEKPRAPIYRFAQVAA